MRFSLKVLTIAFGASTAFAGALTLPASPASAQGAGCPCNISASARDLSRKFFGCGGNDWTYNGSVEWAGSRNITIWKGAKGGREIGVATGGLRLSDYNPNTGSQEFGDHFCEVASGLRKNSGTYRKVTRATITSSAEWNACLAGLTAVANAAKAMGRDADLCYDVDGSGTPDRFELTPPPPNGAF